MNNVQNLIHTIITYIFYWKKANCKTKSGLHITCPSLVLLYIDLSTPQHLSRIDPPPKFHPWWTWNPNRIILTALCIVQLQGHLCVLQKQRIGNGEGKGEIPSCNTFGELYWFININRFWICACYGKCVHVRKSRQFGGDYQTSTGKRCLEKEIILTLKYTKS